MPLLDLPPEIRNAIWTLLVAGDSGWFIYIQHRPSRSLQPNQTRSGVHYGDPELHLDPPNRLTVAFTCRQIYLEATKIYYSYNTFRHPNDCNKNCLAKFLEDIGPHNSAVLTSLEINQLKDYDTVKAAALPSLRRLKLYVDKKMPAKRWNAILAYADESEIELHIDYDGDGGECFYEEPVGLAESAMAEVLHELVAAVNEKDRVKREKLALLHSEE